MKMSRLEDADSDRYSMNSFSILYDLNSFPFLFDTGNSKETCFERKRDGSIANGMMTPNRTKTNQTILTATQPGQKLRIDVY